MTGLALACMFSWVFVAPPAGAGWRAVVMDVSAYCPCAKCCGQWADGITASGRPAMGKLIAAPRTYPFGTEMVVPGYGRARVWDRGGAIKSAGNRVGGKRLRHDRIDLLFPTHKAARRWGRKALVVLVRNTER